MGRAIHELKIPTKYLVTYIIVTVHIIWNQRLKVSTNMSNVVKPQKFVPTELNDFTVSDLVYLHFKEQFFIFYLHMCALVRKYSCIFCISNDNKASSLRRTSYCLGREVIVNRLCIECRSSRRHVLIIQHLMVVILFGLFLYIPITKKRNCFWTKRISGNRVQFKC